MLAHRPLADGLRERDAQHRHTGAAPGREAWVAHARPLRRKLVPTHACGGRAVLGCETLADRQRVARRERELLAVAELARQRARIEPAPLTRERRRDLD